MSTFQLTPDSLVREVAAAYPASMRMLEAMGIDYCCGGKLPLREAAAQRGLPVETVISVLEAAITQSTNTDEQQHWSEASLDELLEHILETHHIYLHGELPRIQTMLIMVLRAHGAHHSDVLRPLAEAYQALQAELIAHLEKEEQVTFPAMRRLQHSNIEVVRRTVRELEEEHERAGAALAIMRCATHDYALPADACNTYRALYDALQAIERDIHQHVHLENNIVFPRVKERLAVAA